MNTDVEQRLTGQAEVEACIPGFALSQLGQIERIELVRDPATGQLVLEIGARVQDAATGPVVVIRMLDARGQLPEFGPGFELSELFVDDLGATRPEAPRYCVHDETRTLHVYCRQVELAVQASPRA